MKMQWLAMTVVALLCLLPAGGYAQGTDPVSLIMAWNEAQNAGDADAALSFMAEAAYIQLVPPPMEGHDGIFRGKDEIRAWWENLYALNGASTVSDCQVAGETVTCLLNYTDDSLKALGLASINNDTVFVVREGKIQTYTATITEASMAAMMAAMPPQSMPETGGCAVPIGLGVAVLGASLVAGALGTRRLGYRNGCHDL